jgi:hypothetical protein
VTSKARYKVTVKPTSVYRARLGFAEPFWLARLKQRLPNPLVALIEGLQRKAHHG